MSTNNIIFKSIKSTYSNFITNLPYYHIDRSGDPLIHNWYDIVISGMQTLGPMNNSLTYTLKIFIPPPPPISSRESASSRTSLACGHLALWAAASPTQNQGTSSSHRQQGRMRHPKWKSTDLDLIPLSQRLLKPNRVITRKSHMAWCQNYINLIGIHFLSNT